MVRPWKLFSKELIAKNPWWSTMHARFEMPDGRPGEYYYVAQNLCINVFVQDADGRFIMMREYRLVLDRVSLSHVQGGVEAGETAEEAAQREMLEEVGYEADTLIKLSTLATVPAFSDEQVILFFAPSAREVGKRVHGETEETEVVKMTAEEIDAAIQSGDIWDSQVVAHWYFVKQYLERV